ncbi:hypothetical protein GALMADRAFT_260204 [Galerina marginata CBS 339.88]|uniref:Uncharacterized protein n=1 Tax=Galerina marginata (strain CBS 339.88) TaxID=685588 RepID=A0A067SCF0_GALM3|nr:hypothetical protein GALMADRAFT_260204 [Galerina marginata CBS 339.88]
MKVKWGERRKRMETRKKKEMQTPETRKRTQLSWYREIQRFLSFLVPKFSASSSCTVRSTIETLRIVV